MTKLFAKKHKYEINSNQVSAYVSFLFECLFQFFFKWSNNSKELFSYGLANVVCSFFMGFPGSVALSRCVILDGIGAKTQVERKIKNSISFILKSIINYLFL